MFVPKLVLPRSFDSVHVQCHDCPGRSRQTDRDVLTLSLDSLHRDGQGDKQLDRQKGRQRNKDEQTDRWMNR